MKTEDEQLVLCDAQTSGGLLASVRLDRVDELLTQLKANAVPQFAVIGMITDAQPSRIEVARSAVSSS